MQDCKIDAKRDNKQSLNWEKKTFVNGDMWTTTVGKRFYSIFRNKAPWFTLSMSNVTMDQFETFEDAASIVELIAEKRLDMEEYRKKPGVSNVN